MKEIELATMAARAYGMDHFVRLPATDYAAIMRPLEAGAGGVMVSMVRSPEEAEQAVRWAKFWPRGERGINGGNRDGRFGLTPLAEYAARANAETFVGIQIETAGASPRCRDRRRPRRRPAVRRPGRPEPGARCHRRLREPALPRGDRADRPGLCRRRKPWGSSRAARLRRPDEGLGCQLFVIAADLHVGARRHPRRQGPLRRVLSPRRYRGLAIYA